MSLADMIVVVILGVCVILAVKGMKRHDCHDCSSCHKKCGGKENGKEFRGIIENQRDTID